MSVLEIPEGFHLPEKKYEYLDHTADVQLHAWGSTLQEAFEQCCMSMFDYMTEIEYVEIKEQHSVEAEGNDLMSLLYHFLDEFLFLFAADPFFIPRRVIINELNRDDFKIKATAYGETFVIGKHPQGADVKAITYSNMQIHENDEKCEVFVILICIEYNIGEVVLDDNLSLMDAVNYILFTNPLSATALKTAYKGGELLQGFLVPKQKVEVVKMDPLPLWKLASKGGFFIRAAGVSGAAAVILGAYGAHVVLTNKDKSDVEKRTFETASKYHFIHSLALIGAPFARYPAICGSLFLVGIGLFCGTCYYSSLTGDSRLNRLTPVGGMSFIFGWLALAVL